MEGREQGRIKERNTYFFWDSGVGGNRLRAKKKEDEGGAPMLNKKKRRVQPFFQGKGWKAEAGAKGKKRTTRGTTKRKGLQKKKKGPAVGGGGKGL